MNDSFCFDFLFVGPGGEITFVSSEVGLGHAKEGRLRYFYALLVLLLAFSSSSSTPPRCDTVTRLGAIKALRSWDPFWPPPSRSAPGDHIL